MREVKRIAIMGTLAILCCIIGFLGRVSTFIVLFYVFIGGTFFFAFNMMSKDYKDLKRREAEFKQKYKK